jgi:hypothetical protein
MLNLVVVDCGDFSSGAPTCDGGDPVRYSGTLADMSSPVTLGTFAGGEKHRYQFSVEVDTAAGNAYQGDSTEVEFTWLAA